MSGVNTNVNGLQELSGTISGTPEFTASIGAMHRYAMAIQMVYTVGTGTASLQGSVDEDTWTDISNSDATLSGSDNVIWNILATGLNYYRVKFVGSTSTVYTIKVFKK